MILKDYKCEQHGYFEADEPICPSGCTDGVFVVHLQAPGVLSETTKHNDKNVKQLAMDFNMTNVKSTREGENQSGYLTRNNEPRPGDAAIWGGGAGMSMQSILGGRIKPVKDEAVGFNPHAGGRLRGPITASYIGDHENLKVTK